MIRHELQRARGRLPGVVCSGRRGQAGECAEHYLGVTDIDREHNEIGCSGFTADEGGEAVNVRRE